MNQSKEIEAMKISSETLISRRDTVVAADTMDEAILLDIDSGYFFQLNKSAASIWALLDQPMAFLAVCDAIRMKFKVDAEQCEDDVRGFVADLAERGIIDLDLAV